ncbi:hypothetical protein GGX14DRAFT_658099, partial [Mycena pura]
RYTVHKVHAHGWGCALQAHCARTSGRRTPDVVICPTRAMSAARLPPLVIWCLLGVVRCTRPAHSGHCTCPAALHAPRRAPLGTYASRAVSRAVCTPAPLYASAAHPSPIDPRLLHFFAHLLLCEHSPLCCWPHPRFASPSPPDFQGCLLPGSRLLPSEVVQLLLPLSWVPARCLL